MATSTSTTTTTTTTTTTPTMRPSQRVLLEAFPAPPSHIPSAVNPPPSGPPALPLPPVPGPSRISVDEQLLFLSSVAKSRRSSKYSVASSHRDSIISIGSIASRRASAVSSSPIALHAGLPPISTSRRDSLTATSPRSSPRTPTFFVRPAISVSAEHTRLSASPLLLSDIEDDESEAIPSRMPSPFLDSSWRRSKHQHNESISSIDVRAILDADEDPARPLVSPSSPSLPHSAPPTATFSHLHSLPLPTTLPITKLQMLKNPFPGTTSSSSNSPSSPFSTSSSSVTSLSDTGSVQDVVPSLTVKDLRLERRAERTKSAGLKREFAVRSRSRIRDIIPEPTDVNPNLSITKTTLQDEMTLDELGPLPDHATNRSRSNTMLPFPVTDVCRAPSPDIETILSKTPRPALKKAASQSRLRSQGITPLRLDRASNPDFRRRASEGVSSPNPPWHASDLQRTIPHGRTMSIEAHGVETGSDDASKAKTGDGDESDSSIDLHTPLPKLMVRDGLLSSNSRLLPPSTRRHNGRSDSVITTASTLTKTGIMKDERDTPMRRVRHRDNGLLKGGIGLTTGLGWSDSEDEDAPSPLTRRLSTLNLSRRSSASSVRTTGSIASSQHRHPLSRSYSSGALLESEFEHLEDKDGDNDDAEQTIVSPLVRPRVLSAGRPALPPTSWQTKPTARTSTSSFGSIDTTLSDSVPRRPSKLGNKLTRPSSGLRDSSGSSENYYDRSSLRRKRSSPGNDRTSSSTASTLSTGMPCTPRDYDPSMSSPAGLGIINPYNIEKSLPPLPNGVLRKRPSNTRLGHLSSNFNFPRARTFSSTSSSVPSPTTPSSAAAASPVRPLHLPRQAQSARATGTGTDRPAVPVPVPSILSSSTSYNSSSIRLPAPRSPPPLDKTNLPPPPPSPAATIRPKPRTGTGMVYRTSSGSRIRAPMTLSSSTSLLEKSNSNSGLSTPVGSIGRMGASRIPPV